MIAVLCAIGAIGAGITCYAAGFASGCDRSLRYFETAIRRRGMEARG